MTPLGAASAADVVSGGGGGGSSSSSALPLHPMDKRAPQNGVQKKLCVRCKKSKGSIAVQTTTYCTPCFQFSFEGKVRPMMEQTRICAYIHRTERQVQIGKDASAVTMMGVASHDVSTTTGRVALGLSGGPSSRALLRLAKERLLPPPDYDATKAKPHEVFAIDVLYVEDSAVVRGGEDRIEEVRALVAEEGGESVGLHFWPIRLEDSFEDGKAVMCTSAFNEERTMKDEEIDYDAKDALCALFEALRPNKVARTAVANARSRIEDLHRLLIMHLLRREAQRRGCSCLLTGENATRRAIRTVEGLGRGQGHKMAVEEASSRWKGMFLLRPMSDVSSKEVAFYLRTKDVHALLPVDVVASELLADHEAGYGSGTSESKASIGRLTESLIQLLENNVPGTINTVNRTSGKLMFHDDEASHEAIDDDDNNNNNDVDEQDVDDAGFRHVGPSMSLRQRRLRRQRDTTSDGGVSKVEQSVRGMGLGGLGAKYYLAAQSWPQFDGQNACPLCQMPVQRGLKAWRKGLTVEKRRVEKIDAVKGLNLSEALCYACNLLLDTPETTHKDARMPLPLFVYKGLCARSDAL